MPPPAIRKSDPMPYYAQLAVILGDQIQQGQWKPGDLLPSEAELCDRFGISRTAVRQALDQLVQDGLLQKEKGRRTLVRNPKIGASVVQELRGFFDEMTRRGEEVSTDIIGQTAVEAPPTVVEELQLSSGSHVVRLDRIRRIGDQPIVFVRTYLPMPRFADLIERDMSEQSLYHLLADDYDVHATSGRRRFEAIAADEDIAELVSVEPGTAMMKVTATNFDQHEVPFEYFLAWYRGDRTSFEVLVEPSSGRADAVLDFDTRGGSASRSRRDTNG